MKTLHLNLKRKWFEMVSTGEKKEEYRDITIYWCKRFILYNGKIKPLQWWTMFFQVTDHKPVQKLLEWKSRELITFINPEYIIFSNGYATKRPQIVREFRDLRIGGGRESWGAEPEKEYFVFSLRLKFN